MAPGRISVPPGGGTGTGCGHSGKPLRARTPSARGDAVAAPASPRCLSPVACRPSPAAASLRVRLKPPAPCHDPTWCARQAVSGRPRSHRFGGASGVCHCPRCRSRSPDSVSCATSLSTPNPQHPPSSHPLRLLLRALRRPGPTGSTIALCPAADASSILRSPMASISRA